MSYSTENPSQKATPNALYQETTNKKGLFNFL